MSQMLKSSGSMAAATLTSRVLGMVREMVYARFMGDSWVAGAFQFAFHDSQSVPPVAGRRRADGGVHPDFQGKGKNRTAKRKCGARPTP